MNALIICPQCKDELPLQDVNVVSDIALCRNCSRQWSYSDLLDRQETGEVAQLRPPSGAWHVPAINGFEVGASTRSPIAFFLVPFMCVWSGFSLGGIYGSQIASGKFELAPSLFGIPFILGTLLFGSFALMAVCGKVVVRVRGGEGTVFTGIGPVGWTRRFDWNNVTSIRGETRYSRNGSATEVIRLSADRQMDLYSLNADRHRFVLAVLRHYMHERPQL